VCDRDGPDGIYRSVNGFQIVRLELKAALTSVMTTMCGGAFGCQSLVAASDRSTPVVLVHGLFGSPANFWALRRSLEAGGIRRFAGFSYVPRTDHQALARELAAWIETVCARSGAAAVDVVGHSLGGLIARFMLEHGDGTRIRRLVTLGAPWYGQRFPHRELAIFGGADWLIPIPDRRCAEGCRRKVIPDCSHLSLLYDPRAHSAVAEHLVAPPRAVRSESVAGVAMAA
jgi:pimeloyl-ACP methyl ester carboxylesterase